MAQGDQRVHIVILESAMLLSKKLYSGWREIQDEYDDYKASLGPWSAEEIQSFFQDEYPSHADEWSAVLKAFMTSKAETCTLPE